MKHFGNPASAEIHESDFLTSCEEARYDAIVANPPYGRFQNIHNRDEIIQGLQREVPFLISKYTNLSILFLYKAIGRLSTHGRLAFLIPSEFLNSRYGTPIKRMLVDNHLLIKRYILLNF